MSFIKPLHHLRILILGAGEMASGVASRLFKSHCHRLLMTEIPQPLAVRRGVSFSEAVYDGRKTVEEVEAVRISSPPEAPGIWKRGQIPLLIDPDRESLKRFEPDVLIDARMAKKNLGTGLQDSPLVIALGPGFHAGIDAHLVIETNRGHHLGRILTEGEPQANTGVPGKIGGFAEERLLRAPADGDFQTIRGIGDLVKAGEPVGQVNGYPVEAAIQGVLRGLIRGGTPVTTGLKLGDVDPRGEVLYCYTISEKARAIAGSVLEGIMRYYNQDPVHLPSK